MSPAPARDVGQAMLTRRSVLRAATAGAAGLIAGPLLAACSSDTPAGRAGRPTGPAIDTGSVTDESQPMTVNPNTSPATPARRVLLAYFSRPGENYYYGGRRTLEVGNTEVLARMISDTIDCDVYRIEAAEPYSDDYDATVARNVREQDTDARPRIANPLPSVDAYDTVLLASPIWNVQTPMIMRTVTDGLNLRGKTIHPVVTYAVSGLGSSERDYARSCPGARIGDSLAVQGEKVRDSAATVNAWLTRTNLT